jgi:hypothetical protein
MTNLKFTPCRRCKHDILKDPSDRVPEGFYKDPDKLGNIIECSHHTVWRKSIEKYKIFIRNGFREDTWELKYPDNYVGEKSRSNLDRVLKFIEVFKTNERARSSTLYIEGPQGCQKTLISSFIGAELTRAGFNCKFIVMNNLIKKLSNWDDEVQHWVDDLATTSDLIVYDESFDLDKLTLYKSNYQIPFLDTFLRSVLRKCSNVFISNVPPDSIDSRFGPSIRDLILREVKFFDSDLRFEDNWRFENNKIPERLF